MYQLSRHQPPGYGGVERVAHSIAESSGGTTFYFLPSHANPTDPFRSSYSRVLLPHILIGKFILPLPSIQLFSFFFGRQSILAHLPCPTILCIAILCRIINPKRDVLFYWHAFLAPRPGLLGLIENIYQRIALTLLRSFHVTTTSPPLLQALISEGIPSSNLSCLPCVLPSAYEASCLHLAAQRKTLPSSLGTIIFIGRLDSYKRIDLLLHSLHSTNNVHTLHILGDGPDREHLELSATSLNRKNIQVLFHGLVSESDKLKLLKQADLLVLPSLCSNEAFGIVQLEAMASGIPSLSFNIRRSGMFWVSSVPSLYWSGLTDDLSSAIDLLLSNPILYQTASKESLNRYLHTFSHYVWSKSYAAIFTMP